MNSETPPSDATTTVQQLRELVEQFVNQRDWHQFHAPKNLSMSMAIEAAELMEHFQWITGDASRAVQNDPPEKAAVGEELADVLCYALAMANELDIDLSSALHEKMIKNREKYPVEKFKGRFE
jgi:NTP pyrophosphatase (non-canonical NTP hydrolase)